MREFGEYLKKEREAKGFTLEQISKETKIRLDYLEAIESGEFHRLPGEFYSRTYIRAYAKTIGLDEDVVMEKYRSLLETAEAEGSEEGRPVVKKWDGTLQSTVASKGKAPRERKGRRVFWFLLIIAILALGAVLLLDYLGYFDFEEDYQAPDIPEATVESTDEAVDLTTPDIHDLATDATLPDQNPADIGEAEPQEETEQVPETQEESLPKTFTLVLKASGDCWYEIRTESGTTIRSGLLRSGQEVSTAGTQALRVLLGKPEVITLVIDDSTVAIPDDVRELIVDSSGQVNILNRW